MEGRQPEGLHFHAQRPGRCSRACSRQLDRYSPHKHLCCLAAPCSRRKRRPASPPGRASLLRRAGGERLRKATGRRRSYQTKPSSRPPRGETGLAALLTSGPDTPESAGLARARAAGQTRGACGGLHGRRLATGTGETGTSASSARLALPCSCLRFAPRHPPTQVLACLALLAARSLACRRRNGGETLRVRDAVAMVLMADGRRCADRRQKKRARSPHGGAAVVSFGHTTAFLPPTPPSSLPSKFAQLPSPEAISCAKSAVRASAACPRLPSRPWVPGPTACSIHGLSVAPLTASSCFC